MKKLVIIAFTLALATSVFAAPGKVKARYAGTIDSYDASTKTLTVNQKDRKGVFLITDTSVVSKNKAKADPSAFVAGQKVDLEFVMDGASKLVQKINVSDAKK
jgi:hypothetical protein